MSPEEIKELIKNSILEKLTVEVDYSSNRVGIDIYYDGEHVTSSADYI